MAPPPALRTSSSYAPIQSSQPPRLFNTGHTSHASFAYLAILNLFRFVLRVFYSNIVVEGVENIQPDGVPCILTANHSNSLTDALLLVTTVPRWVSIMSSSGSAISEADLGALTSRNADCSA